MMGPGSQASLLTSCRARGNVSLGPDQEHAPPPRPRPFPTEPDGRPDAEPCRSGREVREVTDAPSTFDPPFYGALASFALFFTTIALTSVARAADTQRPDGQVTVPFLDQAFPGPGPFILSGTATDDVGVTRGDVAIKDRTSGRWLQPNGTWGPSSMWLRASLAIPGALSTTWTYSLSVPLGAYTVGFRAGDASRKFDASIPWVRFSVVAPPPPPPPPPPRDDAPPNVVLFLTDDQRWDTLWAMPNVQSLLVNHGVTFTNGFVVDRAVLPEPSEHPEGRLPALDPRVQQRGSIRAVQPLRRFARRWRTWLHDGGYHTAPSASTSTPIKQSRAAYVPPGWDRWVAFAVRDWAAGANRLRAERGRHARAATGRTTADYSTDVLAGYADTFIRSADRRPSRSSWTSRRTAPRARGRRQRGTRTRSRP